MIHRNHEIVHPNVVSKYYKFAPEDIDAAIEDFHRILEEQGFQITGELFYSMLSDPTDDIMVAEIFLPIMEDDFKVNPDEELYFRSYFNIKPMVMTRVMDDVEEQSQIKYWELIQYMKEHNLEQSTPVFIEYKSSNQGIHYIEMSAGVEKVN